MSNKLTYDDFVDKLPSGVVRVRPNGSIEIANKEAQRILGLSYDEMKKSYVKDWEGKTIFEDGSDCPIDQLPVSRCLATGDNQGPTVIGTQRPDGDISWASYSAIADKNELGQMEAVVVAFKDITELKNIEEKLRQSEKKYRDLFNNLQEGIWSIDKDAYTDFVNPSMAEMLGYTSEEMNGRHLFEFMDEVGVKDAESKLKDRKEGIKAQHEFEFFRKDGSKIYTLVETAPLFDDEKQYSGALASILDISERKEAEEALLAESFKLKEYFENLPMLAYNVSFDGIIEDVNNVVVKTLGYEDKAELIGKPLIPTIYAPASQDKAKRLIERWKEDKVLKNEELQIITKNGETIDVLLNADTIFDHNGTPMHSLSTHLDITDRKRAEGALIISENLHKEAQRVAKIGHWELDSPSGTPVWSEEIFHIFGLDPKMSEPSFAAHENIIHTEDWPTLNQAITDLNHHGKGQRIW